MRVATLAAKADTSPLKCVASASRLPSQTTRTSLAES